MADQSPYGVLGLQPSASASDVKHAYRSLAKTFHPDRNNTPESTALFQKLNQAYQALMNINNSHERGTSNTHSKDSRQVCYLSLSKKENTFCVTVDVTDYMFLVILQECQTYHDISPIDRRQNGLQMVFPYLSPGDTEQLGSVSLTFYASTSRLHVQGSSYLLWIDEHMPQILARAEDNFNRDPDNWLTQTESRCIGVNRNRATTVQHHYNTRSGPHSSTLDLTRTKAVVSGAVGDFPPLCNSNAPVSSQSKSLTSTRGSSDTLPPFAPPSSLPPSSLAVAHISPQPEDSPVTDSPVTDVLSQDSPVTDILYQDSPVTDILSQDSPVTDVLSQNSPVTDVLSQDSPVTDVLSQDSPVTDVLSQDSPVTDVLTDVLSMPQVEALPASNPTDVVPSPPEDLAVQQLAGEISKLRVTCDSNDDGMLTDDTVNISVNDPKLLKKTTKIKKSTSKPKTTCRENTQLPLQGCSDKCKLPTGKKASDMIRCSLCMQWLHAICIGEGESDYVGVWTCANCRLLPSTVLKLSSHVQNLLHLIDSMQIKENTIHEEIKEL